MTAPGRPLDGVTVLDLTRLLPGAVATMMLRERGAEVIKVEQPGRGDYARSMTPALFAASNVGKRSVALDLKSDAGREALLRLSERADVLVEGFRPGVMERLGLGFDAVAERAPRLVYASLTGYPRGGALAGEAGHDLNYLASEGLLGWPPRVPPYQTADICGGSMQLVIGVLSALLERARTGRGSRVDVAMTAGLAPLALAPRAFGAESPLDGGMPCYSVYRTADGEWLAVGALEPAFWREVCAGLERPEWMDRAFDRLLTWEVADLIAGRDAAEWLRVFAGRDACVNLARRPLAADPPAGRTPALGEDQWLVDADAP